MDDCCHCRCTVIPGRGKMKYILRILILVSTLTTPTLCLPTGAPAAACETLTPEHLGATTQPASTNPYELVLDEFVDPEDGTCYYIPGVTYTSMSLFTCPKQFVVNAHSHSHGRVHHFYTWCQNRQSTKLLLSEFSIV